jgi:ATP-dependent RNA helicase DeaD
MELMLIILLTVNLPIPDEIETYNHRSGRTVVLVTSTSSLFVPKVNCVKILSKESSNKNLKKNNRLELKSAKSLLHLATKIKDTEVDHEIDNYYQLLTMFLKIYLKKID